MEQKTLSNWLKVIIILVTLSGLAACVYVIPQLGLKIARANPEFEFCFVPWLVFVQLTALPVYAALVFAWKIADSIGKDRSFTLENARRLKYIGILAIADSAFFFTGNIVFLLLSMNHPGVALFSLIPVFIGVAIAVAAAGLSHLVKKAAALQEQSDYTI